jgi:hypothetical protein
LKIKAALPTIQRKVNVKSGAFSHRNPFDLNSSDEESDIKTESPSDFAGINPMKRARTTNVNSGSPLLFNARASYNDPRI